MQVAAGCWCYAVLGTSTGERGRGRVGQSHRIKVNKAGKAMEDKT